MSSNISSVTVSGGMFTYVDSNNQVQTLDLGTMMMMLNVDRTNNLDKQISIQMEEIRDRNQLLSKLTKLMEYCRKAKAEGADDGSESAGAKLTIDGVTLPVQGTVGTKTWASELGISWTDVKGSRGNKSGTDLETWNGYWDSTINAIKSKIDTLNNDSQIANIKLQNLLEKRGNAFELATKVMDTNNNTVQSILRNL